MRDVRARGQDSTPDPAARAGGRALVPGGPSRRVGPDDVQCPDVAEGLVQCAQLVVALGGDDGNGRRDVTENAGASYRAPVDG